MPRQARLASLQAKLESDQRLLRQVNQGYTVLNDCLDWISTQKKLKIAKRARDVVQEHQDYYLPVLEIDDYTNLPGALQSLISSLPKVPQSTSLALHEGMKAEPKNLIAFVLDFNVPGVTWHKLILFVMGLLVHLKVAFRLCSCGSRLAIRFCSQSWFLVWQMPAGLKAWPYAKFVG